MCSGYRVALQPFEKRAALNVAQFSQTTACEYSSSFQFLQNWKELEWQDPRCR